MIATIKMHNEGPVVSLFQGTSEIQINGVMASYCSCSKGLSIDLMDLLRGRITQSLHNTLLTSAMKVVLQNIINQLLRGNVCLKIPGPFKSTLLTNPGQHDGSHLRAASWESATWLFFDDHYVMLQCL